MNDFDVHIHYDKIDKIFIAEVKELSGCIAHGHTRLEALNNIETAIQEWISIANENNWEIPEAKDAALSF
ncbi:MAG TPA: type II toxin-antitoxin system HicB family antitoxin [bacterium]|nr:type II toxin-antitoxin system HicB family antitoxin [bacterium]